MDSTINLRWMTREYFAFTEHMLLLLHATAQALPKPGTAQLQELLASTVRSKQRGLEVALDWKQQATGGAADCGVDNVCCCWRLATQRDLQCQLRLTPAQFVSVCFAWHCAKLQMPCHLQISI
jgi:hypothetical protein